MSSDEMTSDEMLSDEMTSDEMSIQDDITYAIIQTTLQQCKESATRSFLFWEDDDKKIGLIIRILHHSFFYSMMIWYFYIHLFSPSLFFPSPRSVPALPSSSFFSLRFYLPIGLCLFLLLSLI